VRHSERRLWDLLFASGCTRRLHTTPTGCTSMLAADFAAEHGVTCDIETIPIDYCNEAMVGCPAGSCMHASLLRLYPLPHQLDRVLAFAAAVAVTCSSPPLPTAAGAHAQERRALPLRD
jgi:hypothetical protein